MYSFYESGVLETIVKLKSRVGQWSAREYVGISNPLYVVYVHRYAVHPPCMMIARAARRDIIMPEI